MREPFRELLQDAKMWQKNGWRSDWDGSPMVSSHHRDIDPALIAAKENTCYSHLVVWHMRHSTLTYLKINAIYYNWWFSCNHTPTEATNSPMSITISPSCDYITIYSRNTHIPAPIRLLRHKRVVPPKTAHLSDLQITKPPPYATPAFRQPSGWNGFDNSIPRCVVKRI